jgi:hypothetical protein
MEEKKFQILSQKQHVRLAQHTLKWHVLLHKCLMVVWRIEDEFCPICFNM